MKKESSLQSIEPTDKQIRLVNWILEHNRSLRRPPFTKHDYWLFIRDHQYAWKRPKYEPDEDYLYQTCVNDIWCEEY